MINLETCNVLVVDDSEPNIDILVDSLGDIYDISVAMDGETALELIREENPDLILLDIMMPGIDGYQVCEELKKDPLTRDIPIIFLSAMTEIEDKTKGFELGAVDYITKPFEVVEVQARVKTHLSLKLANESLKAEHERSENLLHNILPVSIAQQLKDSPNVIAERFDCVSILFADIVNFTQKA
jgi:CheY-like chemotaxis protein